MAVACAQALDDQAVAVQLPLPAGPDEEGDPLGPDHLQQPDAEISADRASAKHRTFVAASRVLRRTASNRIGTKDSAAFPPETRRGVTQVRTTSGPHLP